jgi:hypothetical protein
MANKAIAEVLGTTVEEMLYKNEVDFVPLPEDARRYLEADLEVINSGKLQIIPEETLTDHQGNVRICNLLKFPSACWLRNSSSIGCSDRHHCR